MHTMPDKQKSYQIHSNENKLLFCKIDFIPFFRTICFLSNGIIIENTTLIITPAVSIDTLYPIGIGKKRPQENTTIIPIKAKQVVIY